MSDFEAQCSSDHPLELVADGYAVCSAVLFSTSRWFVWRLTPPRLNTWRWIEMSIKGRNGEDIPAWVSAHFHSRDAALDFIQQDIDDHRALPFDEDEERARLMPV